VIRRPLAMIAVGVLLVAVDARLVALDVAPDAVGWLLVACGAWRLAVRPASWLAASAALASLAELHLPYHREMLDPFTGEYIEPRAGIDYPLRLVFDRLTGGRLVLTVLALVLGGAALWLVLGTLAERAEVTGDERAAAHLGVLRWLVPAAWVVPYVVVAITQQRRDGGFDPVWNGGLESLALVGIGVGVAVAWVLAVNSNRGWTATDEERVGPWSRARPGNP
jgi:hypothetical protein